MQHVTNDMDDLFRKAGEKYPLQTGTPNWDKLSAAMEASAPPVAITPARGSGWRRYALLLLLLPLGWVCNHYWQQKGGNQVAEHEAPAESESRVQEQKANTRSISTVPQTKKTNAAALPPAAMINGSAKQTVAFKNAQHLIVQKRQTADGASVFSRAGYIRAEALASENEQVPVDAIAETAHQRQAEPAIAFTTSLPQLENTQLQPSETYDSTQQAMAAYTAAKQAAKAPATTPIKKIYVGIWASGDLTTVSWQRTSKPGWQSGLLAGYRFSNRWSLETGISLTRKFYYTEGDYFSARYPQSPNNKLTDVTGRCTMLEIPINIRYDIRQGGRSSWFATAGISSYIMKQEDYDLTYLYLNSGNYGVHSYSYKNASRNLFSVLQLSTGYSRQLNKGMAIRIEPALRLPITGLGYGKLKFSSTALQLGVTKDLWYSKK
ncbi:Outer membrane protein beta-barrel domain-containing protein [Cnuella takakiae]|uniref:Outer membrane protein beta-barrel domain-containing protein n=1 Tax=Cnuella takakiae TaxID=1302690 RepID=A0A1M5A1B3_9BACT|nr:outer membrane beta-barrel protein [Cnuella takakiae]OLY92132.1 hypothetical protein BUE76_09655 [Cnuella takakiae]SHF24083.1 Outer membrane protein beta-barrel domain-containing protein [Cnuella takakiae]